MRVVLPFRQRNKSSTQPNSSSQNINSKLGKSAQSLKSESFSAEKKESTDSSQGDNSQHRTKRSENEDILPTDKKESSGKKTALEELNYKLCRSTVEVPRFSSSHTSTSNCRKRKHPKQGSFSSTSSRFSLSSGASEVTDMVQGSRKIPSKAFQKSAARLSSTEVVRSYENNCFQRQGGESCNNPAEDDEYSLSFPEMLKKRKLEMVEQEGDGNCLFRAVSLQVYGDANMHEEVRRRCLEFMAKDEDHFSQFITEEPFRAYIARKKIDGVHGNNPEIQAISELYNRPVEVFVPENGATPINIFHADYKTSDHPIRLSYHDGNHYNAIVDPLCPTAGLGLGLPDLKPGLADEMQLKTAVDENIKLQENFELHKMTEQSIEFQVKKAMIDSERDTVDRIYAQKALALSDMEATDFDIEQMVLAESLTSYQQKKPHFNRGTTNRRIAFDPTFVRNDEMPNSLPFASRSDSSTSLPRSHQSNLHNDYTASASASLRVAGKKQDEANGNSAISLQPTEEADEYPQVVQELVLNGFELVKVLHAYDLAGDNFDHILAILMSSST